MLTSLPDPRLRFTLDDLLDEALIATLAELGMAKHAAGRTTADPHLDALLAAARLLLEQARV